MNVFDPEALSRCMSCGFCLPACPTYALTGDEASSPRGRITLMRGIEDGTVPLADPSVREQASMCLGCRACEPVCPADVPYGLLLEQWRDAAWRGRRTPWLVRPLLALTRHDLLLRVLGRLRRHARPGPRRHPGPHLMLGCVERVLFPGVSRAAQAIDPELQPGRGPGCCGALHAHNGRLGEGEAMGRALGGRLPGTIVTTSGGCAAHLAAVLGRDRVAELSEWIVRRGLLPRARAGARPRVAIQDSCHLRNGLGVAATIRTAVGTVAEIVELPSAQDCCGAAGTYSLLRRRDSARVVAPKIQEIARAKVDLVVTVNPGCQRQLRTAVRKAGLRVRVVHLAELIGGALGTPSR
ncbi:(Fe-S)-binding protein [Actinoplanes sp. NPDC049118]|uniref:(Fe-S)-binding protein n=1 Tax=Actinoplanes sp. NPDC049118 TaxID=3155769 RepID=UPI0033E63A0A